MVELDIRAAGEHSQFSNIARRPRPRAGPGLWPTSEHHAERGTQVTPRNSSTSRLTLVCGGVWGLSRPARRRILAAASGVEGPRELCVAPRARVTPGNHFANPIFEEKKKRSISPIKLNYPANPQWRRDFEFL